MSPFLAASLLALALVGVPAAPVRAQAPDLPEGAEHLPRRSKPPAPGVRPAGLPTYAGRLGVPPTTDAERVFDQRVDGYVLLHFRLDPIHATRVGLHDYDALLPPTDSAGIVATIASLDSVLAQLGAIDTSSLEVERRFDHGLLAERLRGRVRELRTVWARDPEVYLSIADGGLRSLLAYDIAPQDRASNLVARLNDVAPVLRDVRKNLARARPPRTCTEAAIAHAAGFARWLSNRLPTEFAPVKDPVLREEFDHHLAQAAGAAADYYDWLRKDVLSRSDGDGPCARRDSLAGGPAAEQSFRACPSLVRALFDCPAGR